MMTTYRPLTVGEILDRSFGVTFRTYKMLLPFIIFFAVTVALTTFIDQRYHVQNGMPSISQLSHQVYATLVVISGVIIQSVLSLYLFGFGTVVAAALWRGGQIDFRSARKQVRFFTLFKMVVLFSWVGLCTMFFSIFLLIPGVIYFLNRVLSPYILFLEENSLRYSLARSKQLMCYKPDKAWFSVSTPRMRVSGIMLITIVLSLIPGICINAVLLGGSHLDSAVFLILTGVSSMLTTACTLYSTVAYIGFYLDLKSRHEGADILDAIKNIGPGGA